MRPATTTITREGTGYKKTATENGKPGGRAGRSHQGRVKRKARKSRWRLGSIDNFGELGGARWPCRHLHRGVGGERLRRQVDNDRQPGQTLHYLALRGCLAEEITGEHPCA
jgi:hypothetical protein